MKHPSRRKNRLRAAGSVLGAILAGTAALHAQAPAANDDKIAQLEKENAEIKKRLDSLQEMMKKEGITPSGAPSTTPVAAMSQMTLSGFATASYFYDASSSKDLHPAGYLWNTAMNQFTLNKIKLTIASPAVDKDKWDAAYRASFIFGQDARIVDSSSTFDNSIGYQPIREAYVELNVPIGTGLDIRAGELISLLNYESGDGGAVNANFSQGYQWYYTGNPPAAGVQAGYDFNDIFGLKARLQNGLYNGEVGSGSKTFIGGFYVKPDKKTSLAFLGFSGQQDLAPVAWNIDGASFIGSRELIESCHLTFATELDYFHFGGFDSGAAGFPGGADSGNFWSVGGWLTADVCPKVTAALRGELLDDPTGFGTFYNSPNPASSENGPSVLGFPSSLYTTGAGQKLTSLTFTLNYMPVPSLKLQPEIRWNHTSADGAFGNGKDNQIILGMGASYLF
jgi:hypothetical protein